ncbi:MAG: SPOR domain-containing protein [Proteobacteria bacterium]|nr:SPOR domain-containing protein [Pseudomonadota bacterium]
MPKQPRAGIGALLRTLFVSLAVILALLAGTELAQARGRHHGGRHHARVALPAGATDPAKDAALIVDGETGRVLYARNANLQRHPASLTKMMTLYLLFEALKKGEVNMQTMLPISQHAASQPATNLHLTAGEMVPVETAIKAIVVRSANDIAVAIAESLGGTESHFAELMTAKARSFGMHNTFYHNASGLPDQLQVTTAADLVILARHLAYDYPQYFPYFSTPGFSFHGVNYTTHNNLIGRYEGADGIKTGYTQMSGFNLVSSVVRSGVHVIGVVMGGRTAHRRDLEMVKLLDDSFARIASNPQLVAHAGVPWHNNVAMNGAPVIASLDIAPDNGDDEDAAESAGDESDDDNVIAAPLPPKPNTMVAALSPRPTLPPPATVQPSPPPQRIVAANVPDWMKKVHPRAKPYNEAPVAVAVAPTPKPMVVAAIAPAPKPKAHGSGEGDIGDPPAGARSWTIQIGAFADLNQARGQLASYAERSMDILGQAARIVIPFTAVDGHTLYRARFGPFVEREAREVCSRLTQRGQTCFTVMGTQR